MKYYKNAEIANEYGVSLPTVANWIKDTLSGKKNLELAQNNDKIYIAKTDENTKLIQKYVSKGFKYKPSNARVVVEPKPDYIKYFSDKQLIELKKCILDKKLIDIKFAYIDGGANLWNETYTHSQVGSTNQFVLTRNKMSILSIPRVLELAGTKKVNVVEIGAGNGKPLLEFLHKLSEENRLNSYISIDISSEMNEIQKQNLLKEFPNLVFNSYVVDVENDTFEDIVYEIHQNYPETMNIFVMFGGTFGNFISPEKTIMNIEKSMLTGDLLCIDNPHPHPDRFKDAKYMYESPTVDHYLFASRSLGLQVSAVDLEYHFDAKTTTKKLFLNIPFDHTIKLTINDREETIDLPKGMKIQVWQHRMTNLDYIQNITKPYDLFLVLYTISSDT
jgi:SAM-dependent methyltransferase